MNRSELISHDFNRVISHLKAGEFIMASALLESMKPSLRRQSDLDLHAELVSRLPRSRALEIRTPRLNDVYFSSIECREPQHGISIVSCCMNRNENLVQSLISWLKLPVNEIVLVDWSSEIPVVDTIGELADDRIRILRINGESRWVLTYAFNVGLRFASFSKIYKLDADIVVTEDFLQRNDYSPGEFVRGSWAAATEASLDDQVFVNGSFGAFKSDLQAIGYYNEYIRTYGWDDSDLYERLVFSRHLAPKVLDIETVYHLEQEEESRTQHQNVASHLFLGRVKNTDFQNRRNQILTSLTGYWEAKKLQNFRVVKNDDSIYCLERITSDVSISSLLNDTVDTYTALSFMKSRLTDSVTDLECPETLANLFWKEYTFFVPARKTLELLDITDQQINLRFFSSEHANYEEFVMGCIEEVNSVETSIIGLSSGEYCRFSLLPQPGRLEIVSVPEVWLEEIARFRDSNSQQKITSKIRNAGKQEVSQVCERLCKKRVYIDAQHGLGNRLRAIASAAAIANGTDRELVIIWEADHHCDCQFEDLFQYDGAVVNKSFIAEAYECMDVFNYMTIEPSAEKDAPVSVDQRKDLYLRSAYTLNSPFSDWDRENSFLKSLRPAQSVVALLDGLDVSSCIGAHIRMEGGQGSGLKSYDSSDNWTTEEHLALQYWRDKSHYSNFINRIDQLLNERPSEKLFIAADSPSVYSIFRDYYGERLVCLEREAFDRSKEQLLYAFADILLLSRTSKLLCSNWSSFSEIAVRLSSNPSESEWSGKDF